MRRDLGLSKLFVWHTYGTKKVIYTRTTFPHLRCVIMHFVDKYHDGMAETQPDNTHRRHYRYWCVLMGTDHEKIQILISPILINQNKPVRAFFVSNFVFQQVYPIRIVNLLSQK